MATRRRDIAPRKDKTGPSPSHTSATNPKATSIFPSKTNPTPQNHNPRKLNTPTSLKPTIRTSANDGSKQRVIKKPTSTDTPPHKPSQKTHLSTNQSLRPHDKTPLPSQKTHVTTNPSIRSRDKTPLPEQKTHVTTNQSIRSRDKTPLPEQKSHVTTNPSIRDKTPLPARKTQVPTNPSIRDKTPLPTRKTHVSTNPSHQSRDKTPLPAQKRHVATNPSIRDKTPLPTRKTHVSTNPSHQSRDKTPLPEQKRHIATNPSVRDKTPLPARKTQVPTNPSIRDKTPLPTRNTHVTTSATPSVRSSSIPGKTTASQKMVPGKSSKALTNDVRSLHVTPLSTTLKGRDIYSEGQETDKSNNSATNEKITNTFQENVENPNVYQNVPEVETLPEDQECCTIVETEEHILQVVSNDEKGTVDFVLDDQEKSFQIEAKGDDDSDAKIDINEPSPVLELQEAPLDIETQEYEEKLYIEDKLEEISVHEIDNTNNSNKSVADDYSKEEDKEKEVEKVVVVEKEEKEEEAFDKNDEVASESEAIKSMETKMQEVVENQKQEPENKAPKQGELKGKKDSIVSNDVIEETASKLREQRKNRVRALAGAFETVISLQN